MLYVNHVTYYTILPSFMPSSNAKYTIVCFSFLNLPLLCFSVPLPSPKLFVLSAFQLESGCKMCVRQGFSQIIPQMTWYDQSPERFLTRIGKIRITSSTKAVIHCTLFLFYGLISLCRWFSFSGRGPCNLLQQHRASNTTICCEHWLCHGKLCSRI